MLIEISSVSSLDLFLMMMVIIQSLLIDSAHVIQEPACLTLVTQNRPPRPKEN